MGETKHTPGPWGWESHPDTRERIALAARENDVLLATGDDGRSWLIASDADAQLIEHAPDLFAALAEILAAYDANDTAGIREGIEASRAAIARATGNPA